MKALAFSPAHITGFFEIRDNRRNPMRIGSRGAGVCLCHGITTRVETTTVEKSGNVNVLINGSRSPSAIVSIAVAKRLLTLSSKPSSIRIYHNVTVPIGGGFGTSGAAAIGVALAGSEALGLNLSTLEAYQLAHAVEVELKTGLGTVAGVYCGGLEVRAKEGAPGYGKTFQVPLRGRYSVVALNSGPLLTSKFLSDPDYRERINSIGSEFLEKMLRTPNLRTFLRLAHEFSAAARLGNEGLMKVINVTKEHGYLFAMAMFGQTVFTIVRENEVSEVTKLVKGKVRGYKGRRKGKIIVSPVDTLGGRLLAKTEKAVESRSFCASAS